MPGLYGQQQNDLQADLLDGLIQSDQPLLLDMVFQTAVLSHVSMHMMVQHTTCKLLFLPCLQKQCMPEPIVGTYYLHMCSRCRFAMYASNLFTSSFNKPERQPYTHLNARQLLARHSDVVSLHRCYFRKI